MKFQQFALFFAVIVCSSTCYGQLTFNFVSDPNTAQTVPQSVLDGFNEAGQIWSSVLDDPVEVSIFVGYSNTAGTGGALAVTDPTAGTELYSDFRTALSNDATSSTDFSAVSHLQPGPNLSVWINRTFDNPFGIGSPTAYLDNNGNGNNQAIVYTTANARAIGIETPSNVQDGIITINSDASWDFDRSNGIGAGSYDFVGVAVHEIGHVLGFFSQVDAIDLAPLVQGLPLFEDQAWATPLDLFRFSPDSLAQGAGIHDMTADTRSKYFSIDGGTTNLAEFSTGILNGDGRQASHWVNANLGLMGPTAATGQEFNLNDLDLTGFDAIGWDRVVAVPEPVSGIVCGLTIGLLIIRRRRT